MAIGSAISYPAFMAREKLKPLDEKRKLLFVALSEKGIDLKDASRRLGRNQAYVHQYIYRGTPRFLTEADRRKLSVMSGLTELELGIPGEPYISEHIESQQIALGQKSIKPPQSDPSLLPMYGVAEAGDGSIEMTGEVISYIPRPDLVMGIGDAYGLYVVGESMEPAYYRGDTVIVNPKLPPRPSDAVILAQGNPATETTALIKEMVRIKPTEWDVHQFNPPKTFSLSKKLWKVCHRIVIRYPR